MRCESCSINLSEDSAFCPECGERSALSAAGIVDRVHTSGLVRGRAGREVPEPAPIADLPSGVPQIPEAAPLPDAVGADIPSSQVVTADVEIVSSVDRARIREEARRAAQALVETAQTDLREELAEIAEREARIEQREEALADTDRNAEPPPPPPTAEERIWAETDERAKLHGTTMPWGEQQETQRDQRMDGEADEDRSFNCCVVIGVAFMLIVLLLSILGLILTGVQ